MLMLCFPPIPANSPIQPSTNPPTVASTSSSAPSTQISSQPQPETTTEFTNGDGSQLPLTRGPNIPKNVNERAQNDSGNNMNDAGGGKGNKNGAGVAAAVVIVLLLLIGAGVAVAVVVLVLYLRKRDESLASCFKSRGRGGLFAMGGLSVVRL